MSVVYCFYPVICSSFQYCYVYIYIYAWYSNRVYIFIKVGIEANHLIREICIQMFNLFGWLSWLISIFETNIIWGWLFHGMQTTFLVGFWQVLRAPRARIGLAAFGLRWGAGGFQGHVERGLSKGAPAKIRVHWKMWEHVFMKFNEHVWNFWLNRLPYIRCFRDTNPTRHEK